MAFFYTADKVEDILPAIGSVIQLCAGSVALDSGSAVVTVRGFKKVKMAIASSQTSNAARVSAVSANTFTITGTSSDRVDWLAYGIL